MRTSLAIFALVALCTACSSDDPTADATGAADSTVIDSASTDAAANACDVYCDCMAANCPNEFPNRPACLAACGLLSEGQLSCRTMHCGFALGDPNFHCPHTVGIGMCQ